MSHYLLVIAILIASSWSRNKVKPFILNPMSEQAWLILVRLLARLIMRQVPLIIMSFVLFIMIKSILRTGSSNSFYIVNWIRWIVPKFLCLLRVLLRIGIWSLRKFILSIVFFNIWLRLILDSLFFLTLLS